MPDHSERTPLLSTANVHSNAPRACTGVFRRAAGLAIFGLVFVCALWAVIPLQNRRKRPLVVRAAADAFSAPPTILAVGDWGRDGKFGQKAVAAALADVAGSEQNVRIVSTGDNFYENGVLSVVDRQFNNSYEHIYNVYESLRSTQFWPVLGNHDHLGNPLAQIDYSARSPQWDMPSRFYARSLHPSLLLIFLDTTPYVHNWEGKIARRNGFHHAPETEWLKSTLANAPESHFLIFGHHNMYSANLNSHMGTKHVRKRLEPILAKYRNRVLGYVCGHEHAIMHLKVNGLDHFVSGGGSELDNITKLNPQKDRDKWRSKHGVVRGDEAPFVQSVNGFFKLQFLPAQGIFDAVVYDAAGKVAYRYNKRVQTAEQIWRRRFASSP